MNKGFVLMLLALVMAVIGFFINEILLWTGVAFFLLLLFILLSTQKTPRRNVSKMEMDRAKLEEIKPKAQELIQVLGGRGNILGMSSCLSRVRITVDDIDVIAPDKLKELGATGMVVAGNQLQAIFGGESEPLRQAVEDILRDN